MPDRLTKTEREEARKTCAKLLDSRRRYVMPSTATDVAQNYLPRALDDLDRVEGEVGRLEKRDAIARNAMQAVAGLQVCADIGALAETARWRKTARRMAGEAREHRATCEWISNAAAKRVLQLRAQRDTARTALAQRDGWIRMLLDGVCPECGAAGYTAYGPDPSDPDRLTDRRGPAVRWGCHECGYSITADAMRAGIGGASPRPTPAPE